MSHMETLLGLPDSDPNTKRGSSLKPLKHTCKDCVKYGSPSCGATSPEGFCINIEVANEPLAARPSTKKALIKDLMRFYNHLSFFVDQNEFPSKVAIDITEDIHNWSNMIIALKDKKEFKSLEEILERV